ncbi:MAG: VanZ like family [Bacteroidota bacterium]|jgi:hypothetical protein
MKAIKIFTHPIFIYLIITVLCCLPKGTEVLNEMPNVGDNFKSNTSQTVYYYNGKGKLDYQSPDCFFKLDNPPFETNWQEGGIKTINESIVNQIPLLGNMCDSSRVEIKAVPIKKVDIPWYFYISKDYLLSKFSEVAHFISYLILSISLLNHIKHSSNKYFLTITACLVGGIILEFVQHFFIPGREASIDDVVLNMSGCLVGVGVYRILNKYFIN